MKTLTQREPAAEPQHGRSEFVIPEVDIYETKDGYILEAEMPGVSKEGLEVTLEGNELTITGHRQAEALRGEALLAECGRADYRRVFELDPAIDTANVAARMDQGVLILNLPKSEKVKPRKIKVD